MKVKMSHELTLSQQSNKDDRLFRWIILGSTIPFLILFSFINFSKIYGNKVGI
jgi:hypothetical protein